MYSHTNLEELRTMLEAYIENFETQSGTPEERQEQEVISSLIKVFDRSHAPHVNWSPSTPLAGLPESPLSSETPKLSKRTAPKATAEKLAILNSQINTGFTSLQTNLIDAITVSNAQMTEQIVKAIKSTPAPVSPFSNINWAPLIQGITNVVVTSLGGSVNYPSAPISAVQSGEVQSSSTNLAPIVDSVETRITTLESSILALAQS